MRYLIPSIGRCASSVMAHQIHKACGSRNWQYRQDYATASDMVIKTHAPYTVEPEYEYRAVFCTGHMGNVIASMMRGMDGHLINHLRHLEVMPDHLATFQAMMLDDRLDAWLYLIVDDKLRLKQNYGSWHAADPVLFVHYQDWKREPIQTAKRVSAFVGASVAPVQIRPHRGRLETLPLTLQDAICREYGELA